ncbi:regulatory protein RecX [Psychromonas sp. MME2]|uniref:regulatory protein RecX n=1 Tax=unclassified Psychromonas TaxID=2614957 RepID=UPI00339CAB81
MTPKNHTNNGIKVAKDIEGVRRSALWHLSRRDHSEMELRQKLARKSDNQQWVDDVISECFHYGYLDDNRFVNNFIRACQQKGFAKNRIIQALQRKGIESDLIASTLLDNQFEYITSAIHSLNIKFPHHIASPHLKQKAMAFLQTKGHSFDDIQRAIEQHNGAYPMDEVLTISDALLLLNNKFKNSAIVEAKSKNKALRFLVSRGFSFTDALAAIKQYSHERDQ